MAERRMFAKTIVLSDAFLDMPMSARCLYFTLSMLADDDGFVNSPKGIMRQCGASLDDMNILLAKKFILTFDSGVIVIKHWRIHNYIQKDRYKETKYIDEKSSLAFDDNGAYTKCIQPVSIMDTQVRLGKDRLELGKDRLDSKPRSARTIPPTLDEVKAYCKERNNTVDADKWFDHYTANGWMVGKTKMKDWKAAVRTWERNEIGRPAAKRKEIVPDWMNDDKTNELERLKSVFGDVLGEQEKTAGNNPELAARAEALKQQLAK